MFRQETGERTGQRGFPLCDSPTPAGNSARSNARLPELCADSGLPARPSPLSMHTPFRSHARGADYGATEKTPCRSYPKRGKHCPIAAHEVKRRPQIVCRAPDGAGSIATRAGFLRAEPLGVSFVQPFLHGQKRAGRRRQKHLEKLQFTCSKNLSILSAPASRSR